MSKFKLGLILVFTLFIFIGLVVFALSKNKDSLPTANLVVWGTISQSTFDSFFSTTELANNRNLTISYYEKSEDTFDQEFVEALADGRGPDMVVLPENMIFKHKNKIMPIPYQNYSERVFKDSFLEAGEIFLTKEGILSVPFMVDPMVMYWNRDIFKNASQTLPPKYWDEFLTLTNLLNKKDNSGNFSQTAVSLGEWKNVYHAKDIFANMLLQLGNPIVSISELEPRATLNDFSSGSISPGEAVINFYTQFANPTSINYSWNRSLPTSVNYFLSGNLATYFGFASELPKLRAKNPNLNFDVTFMPSPRQNTKKIVLSRIYGISILKFSKNIGASFSAMTILTNENSIKNISDFTNLPPVRRYLLLNKQGDAYKSIFYDSAIFAKTWADPDRKATDKIFQDMVEYITSGRSSIADALSKANIEMYNVVKK